MSSLKGFASTQVDEGWQGSHPHEDANPSPPQWGPQAKYDKTGTKNYTPNKLESLGLIPSQG